MDKPLFLLGVGCQKGGTTWLYDYLSADIAVQLSLPKELHIFDTMLRPDLYFRYYLRCLNEDRHQRKQWRPWRKDTLTATPRQRIEMMNNPAAYIAYFKQFAGKRVTGEITPSYAVLNGEDFTYIRSLLDDHFHVKAVFLMRDPIERTRSALRMRLRPDHNKTGRHLNWSESELFRRQFDKTMYLEQSLYNNTIASLEAAFPSEDILYGFFETMFDDAFLERVCEFLTIDVRPGNFARIMNGTPKADSLDPALIAMARAVYDPAYAFCADRFGEDFIASIWPHYRLAPAR